MSVSLRPRTALIPLAVSAGLALPLIAPSAASAAEPIAGGTPTRAIAVPAFAPAATPAEKRHLRANATRQALVKYAKSKVRTGRYVAGAASRNRFDCSGMTLVVYKKIAHVNLPHFSGAQMKKTKRVSRKDLLPGDLLFFGHNGGQHVAMYIGHGKMVGANNPRAGVQIDRLSASYWASRYAGAGRVIMG